MIQPIVTDKKIKIEFPQCDKLVPPVIAFTDVSFSYSGKPEDYLYEVRRGKGGGRSERVMSGEGEKEEAFALKYLL